MLAKTMRAATSLAARQPARAALRATTGWAVSHARTMSSVPTTMKVVPHAAQRFP
jgi:hypothetical protein